MKRFLSINLLLIFCLTTGFAVFAQEKTEKCFTSMQSVELIEEILPSFVEISQATAEAIDEMDSKNHDKSFMSSIVESLDDTDDFVQAAQQAINVAQDAAGKIDNAVGKKEKALEGDLDLLDIINSISPEATSPSLLKQFKAFWHLSAGQKREIIAQEIKDNKGKLIITGSVVGSIIILAIAWHFLRKHFLSTPVITGGDIEDTDVADDVLSPEVTE